METGFIDYTHCLRMGEWEQSKVIQLFAQPDDDKLLELIESSRKSGILGYSRSTGGGYSDVPRKYFYEPVIIIEWALAIGLTLPIELTDWYDRLVIPIASPQSSDEELSETESTKLLKQIGLLALALAEAKKNYKIADRPNVSKINETVQAILDALPEANRRGVESSSIRESISKGLDLLNK